MAQPKKEQTMFLLQLVENFTIQRDELYSTNLHNQTLLSTLQTDHADTLKKL